MKYSYFTTFYCNFVAKFELNKKVCNLYLPVLKILKTIFNIVIWTVVGLYLMVILTFSIPSVQEYLGQKVAGMLSRKLGTSVSIGRLDYGLLNRLTLHEVNIKDQRGRDMLYAGRLSVRLDLLPLSEGKISIATAQLFGVHAKLYKASETAKPNFQFVIDSLASKDTTSSKPLDLRINSLIIRHSSVKYDQLDIPRTPHRLNPRHLLVKDISTHIVLKTLTPDSLNVTIKRLAFKEQSGLDVNRLALHFEGGRSKSRLTDFLLRMAGTNIQLGDCQATYRFRGDHFVSPSLRWSGSIEPSTVTPADLTCLLPSLKTFQSTLSMSANLTGEGSSIEIPRLLLGSTTGDINVDISGGVQNLQQHEPQWKATIHNLDLSAQTISFIHENLSGQQIEMPQELLRLGNVHLTGTVNGQGISTIETHNQLNTEAGNVSMALTMDRQHQLTGHIDTKGVNLRRVLDDNRFGQLATTIDIIGNLSGKGGTTVKANGVVNQFEYNGYNYQNIHVDGLYSPNDIHGQVSINDANIALTIDGNMVRENRQQRRIYLDAVISQLHPKNIRLTDRWDDAAFSAQIQADFLASSINDAVGELHINNFNMESPRSAYHLQRLDLTSGYESDQHIIRLNSDFGQAAISGNFDYKTLAQSFTNILAAKIPTLPGLPAYKHTHNEFSLQATISKSDWLQHLLQIPVELRQPLTLQGMVSDSRQQMAITCEAPQLYYNDSRYDKCYISILSPLNMLQYDVRTIKLMDDGKQWDLQVMGSAYNNQLIASLLWDNHEAERMSGKITAKAAFSTTPDGQQVTHVTFAPSAMTVNNTKWNVRPATINYMPNHLDIRQFTIECGDQFLTLDGIASEHSEDSLTVQMRGVDIEYILDLVNFHAVTFSGKATGGGTLRNVFGELEANGALTVDQFEFEHGRMGTLKAAVDWNRESKQIDIRATADDGPDAITLINGYVSPERNYIDLNIRANGTHIDFAHSFLSSFIDRIEGHANGDVRLAGPLDAINLTGQLVINGNAHVSTLGCTYELKNDSLQMVPNEITLTNFPAYDIYGNRAMLTGGIHHKELTNLTYDINISAQKLLAYDFQNFGTNTFYGTVFATGEVGIHGRESSVLIEADVTPQPGTVFVYNAASPESVSSQEFIQWGNLQDTKNESQATQKEVEEEREFRSDLTMRLKINATPNATVRLLMDERTNDYITLQGNGELQTSFYNKGGFQMFGTYRVTEGTYGVTIQNIIKKNFVFREGGTVVFGGDPYDAALNLQAQHTVNGVSLSDLNVGKSFANTVRVNCLMNITGQPRAPQVDFDLEMPNVNADEQQMVRSIINSEEEMNQQVVYLLAVGRFYPQGANNATDTEKSPSKTSLAMQSLLSGTLSGQINNVLGQVIKSNNWNFGANISTGDEGWNNAEYEGIINGRLLNNRLLINGQFGYRDNTTTATPSFIGDFDIRYLLLPNGNLAMKVYNQSNDRYFTKSSLNTQGLGIIMKKDFNGLRDLFGIHKNKKRKDKNTKNKQSD